MAIQGTYDVQSPAAADSSRMTPETIERRRRIAEAMGKPRPIQHWMQGVAQLAEGVVGGLTNRRLDEAERRNAQESADAIRQAYSTAFGAAGNPVSAAAPMGNAVARSLSAGGGSANKIYSGDEPSPLDPPSGADRDTAIRTIIAEAGNQGGAGMNAVGSVIRNRAVAGNYGGDNASAVVTAPNQFEPHGTPEGRARMAAIDPNGKQYAVASQALESAYAGNDPTNGATNFYAPKAQAALGRPAPAWDNGRGVDIGDHRFFGGASPVAAALAGAPGGSQAPYQVAGPAVASPGARGAPPAPATAPQAGNTAVVQALGPQPDMSRLIAAASSPYLSPQARSAAMQALQTVAGQQKVQTVDLGNKIGILNARGQLVGELPKGEPNKGPEMRVVGKDEFDREIYGEYDPRKPEGQRVTPYSPQRSTDAQPSVIPPPPPGVDPAVWRKAHSERATEQGMPADSKAVSALRNEVQGLPSYKNIAQAAPIYKSMVDAAPRDNRAADVNMIYGLGKIMDPTSVVRDSEMVMAQGIATLPQQMQAQAQSFLQGSGRLTPEVRAHILKEAHSRMRAYQSVFDQDANMYRGIAQRQRMQEADVLPTFGPFDEYQPPAPAPAPAARAAAPAAAPAPGMSIDAVDAELRRRGVR